MEPLNKLSNSPKLQIGWQVCLSINKKTALPYSEDSAVSILEFYTSNIFCTRNIDTIHALTTKSYFFISPWQKGVISLLYKNLLAAISLQSQQPMDDRPNAALTFFHSQGVNRAITGTGAAFHALVTGNNLCLAVIDFQDPMGTNLRADAAAYAEILIKLQGDHIVDIMEDMAPQHCHLL